jgi:hypothetical protein
MQFFAKHLAQDGNGDRPVVSRLAMGLLERAAQYGIDRGLVANALRLGLGSEVLDDVIAVLATPSTRRTSSTA